MLIMLMLPLFHRVSRVSELVHGVVAAMLPLVAGYARVPLCCAAAHASSAQLCWPRCLNALRATPLRPAVLAIEVRDPGFEYGESRFGEAVGCPHHLRSSLFFNLVFYLFILLGFLPCLLELLGFWLSILQNCSGYELGPHQATCMFLISFLRLLDRHGKACDVKNQPKKKQSAFINTLRLVLCTLSFVRSSQFLVRFSLYTLFQG